VAVWPLGMAGRRTPWAVALGRIGPNTVRRFKILFSDLFNPRNGSKLLEFVETVEMSKNCKLNFIRILLSSST
jgi:hypothetical protein